MLRFLFYGGFWSMEYDLCVFVCECVLQLLGTFLYKALKLIILTLNNLICCLLLLLLFIISAVGIITIRQTEL